MNNDLTAYKQISTGAFKNVNYKLCVYKYYDMYKEDLALNNLQWLTCHKTKANQTKSYIFNMCT